MLRNIFKLIEYIIVSSTVVFLENNLTWNKQNIFVLF